MITGKLDSPGDHNGCFYCLIPLATEIILPSFFKTTVKMVSGQLGRLILNTCQA